MPTVEPTDCCAECKCAPRGTGTISEPCWAWPGSSCTGNIQGACVYVVTNKSCGGPPQYRPGMGKTCNGEPGRFYIHDLDPNQVTCTES